MPELPRITRSLRWSTDLGRIKSTSFLEPNDLLRRQEKEHVNIRSEFTWQDLTKETPTDASFHLKNLWKIAERVLGECPSPVIDEFLMFTIQLLIDEKLVLRRHYAILKQKAVNLTFEDTKDMLKVITAIKEKLDENVLRLIRNGKENVSNGEMKMLFHPKFEYKRARVLWPETDKLRSMTVETTLQSADNFSMKYKNEIAKSSKSGFDKARYNEFLKNKHGQLELSLAKLEEIIVDKLAHSENVEDELLSLLGFESMEFMEYLIQHKGSIIASVPKNNIQKQVNCNADRPVISGQVTIQSEKEKELFKQVRKEEKKMNKRDGKVDYEDNFALSIKRHEALTEMRAPIFRESPVAGRVKYPFVFDSISGGRGTSGFVSQQKMMLPENAKRENTQMYEKVHIPAPEVQPVSVNYTPVKVSSLDDIGRQAFSGVESLNRIQSIVFNAAYNTNENLLICAPTGAGKTNIAMLTVIHQLKQHMEHGELMKNQFKIIYVAPMKALAAEMTANFGKRLQCLGICVRELTGDMQLTKSEIQQTQMIVTTPEKWDVVTRKGTGDISLTSIVKLLIIDEVHLLHGDRGPVVEALVARTLRQVESSQSMIRIVGLSATLPNYVDVATFLRVNPEKGLFYFDHQFRPVPLSQTFIGVKASSPMQEISYMDQVCYDNVIENLRQGHQVMVFVHARNATVRVAKVLRDMASKQGTIKSFIPTLKCTHKPFAKSRNRDLMELFNSGLSVHHAGLLRSERNMVEKYFADGLIKVLVCTSTLAWGVNLPAHAVIIRGTEIYDSKHGSFIDLGILDVLQIFGRAGRPQFDSSGYAVIITAYDKLSHYLRLLTNQIPIESSFIKCLADNLNAEIALGTISNVEEAVKWLSYTYLFVRMKLNHDVYGIPYKVIMDDPNLEQKRRELIDGAAMALDEAKMIRYSKATGDLSATNLGRIASHFYLKYDTIKLFNELRKPIMMESEIFAMISQSQEFEQLKVREDEMNELDDLCSNCELTVKGGKENIHGKVNILLQTYLSHGHVNSFSLMSDQTYIVQNAVRISRALFQIMLGLNNALMTGRLLEIAKMIELQQWNWNSPLRQFTCLPQEVVDKIDDHDLTIDRLNDMTAKELADVLRVSLKTALLVQKCCDELPALEMDSTLQPITRTVLRIRLKIYPQFQWNDKVHGKTSEPFWIWIEDPESNMIYHHEYFMMTRKMVYGNFEEELVMTIPLQEPLPSQYIVRAVSDRWLGCEYTLPLTFHDLILPEMYPPHTDLLKLQPLPVKALKEPAFERLYRFTHFNPIQTQIFHCLYHTDNNVLLGAPTGSGKTIAAEIAMFRVFKQYPTQKIVYIAPLKALVRERIKDWKVRLEERLGKKVVELTGDVSPDIKVIASASVIVTTPEKWDGISRSWQTRNYVKNVSLIIIDEIHLLGEDRGPVLEVIISRTNFISSHTTRKIRIVGLSTALANAVDLAHWLGIGEMGMYNFRPSVRPVPLEIHIDGFPGKNYCPRMATMNRPTFQAIRQHAPDSPSLVFVSSRRQTRLTALDLIAYLAAEDNPKQWLNMPDDEMCSILDHIKDTNLKLTLAFGIGLHHAGLQERDRRTVEELFVNNKIQVLITTATLAWGVNFPAHLVVIKGTEYFDGKQHRYVDMPITDVLQMMGRAGRPQFDTSGVAVILVHDLKKEFYKKFLHEPFPVESSLLEVLPDHINAEVVSGTIKNKQELLDYLTWTYFFRRLLKNPGYYNLSALEPHTVNQYLSYLVDGTLKVLIDSHCVDYVEEDQILYPLPMGQIASFYYLSYRTMSIFEQSMNESLTLEQCLRILCNSHEYDELPVRHDEEFLNEELSKMCLYKVEDYSYSSPHTKTFLLLQAHFSRLPMPCVDYLTDLKSVLDQAIRIIQAMIDIVAEHGWLASTLMIINLLQMIIQARWIHESPLITLPHVNSEHLPLFESLSLYLPKLCSIIPNKYNMFTKILGKEFREEEIHQMHMVLKEMPVLCLELHVESYDEEQAKQFVSLSPKCTDVVNVHKDQDYILNVGMRRKNRSNCGLKAHCPMFQKGKDEGWFLVLGNSTELLAMKRAAGVHDHYKSHPLQFTAPSTLGSANLTFRLMSDCYMGLDQQYNIKLNVIP
ncbi:activating signal cointegrator 1 complex subunit 3 [Ceratina calcarata]|uniref:Activating signal cointegrator 1 complex subunit 3 n=1 Tax=Ceratina calcarata TaxID=156304 RepID=A0AAJ7W9L1_9HYME|nr:activating signal cointegrator 1 complex subunit 3 [Ceratina calcarata]XP_017877586.1 activating signal cointegrator 1 complex subunit 3 [Ceratina calcarata]XP_017877587.1 activating signal cointegrator 1 complex subunit 3 [Ceratina calcarata]XP_026668180.1 activating signal cointegrator 1 complex subunit 3 [Ceratina calcarata]